MTNRWTERYSDRDIETDREREGERQRETVSFTPVAYFQYHPFLFVSLSKTTWQHEFQLEAFPYQKTFTGSPSSKQKRRGLLSPEDREKTKPVMVDTARGPRPIFEERETR